MMLELINDGTTSSCGFVIKKLLMVLEGYGMFS